jgi:hypothetical protein
LAGVQYVSFLFSRKNTYKLQLFENSVARKIRKLQRGENRGQEAILNNDGLYDLYWTLILLG